MIDWSDKGVRWPTTWRLPYGPGPRQLSIKDYRDQDPIVPSAVAALPSGSYAVVDPQNRRVVEINSSGTIGRTITEVPQVASDIAWDRSHRRLLVIANESEGKLIEIPDKHPSSDVDLQRPVSRLVPTDLDVYGLGANSYDELYGLTVIPSPLSAHPAVRGTGIGLGDGSQLTFSSNQNGSEWVISRSSRWTLRLVFVGRNGPHEPALSLIDDMLITGNTLVMAPAVGALQQADVSRQLLLLRVDLDAGTLLGMTHLRQCGLREDANVVSRITASDNGSVHQFCVGWKGVTLRSQP